MTVLKSISRAGIIATVLVVLLSSTARAQIAPTNSAALTGSVADSAGKPIADALVSVSGPKSASTRTDARGLFAFIGLPLGIYELSAAAAGLGTATRSVVVTGDTNVAIQYEATSQNGLKTIATVSTRANAGFNVTSASVTQVNLTERAFQGETQWRKILEQIPGIAQVGPLNGQRVNAGVALGPLQPMQISINGTFAYESAVLLDNMPLISGANFGAAPAGGGTNLAAYPLNGFSTADIVRGPGANAPTIVDSVGGSFVLHSPGPVQNNHYNFSISSDPYGGFVANGRAAVRLNKLSAVLTYGVNDSPGPVNDTSFAYHVNTGAFLPQTVNGQAFACINSCGFGLLNKPGFTGGSSYGFSQGLLFCCEQNSTAWTVHGGSLALNYQASPAVNASLFYAGQNVQSQANGSYYTWTFTPPAAYSGNLAPGTTLLLPAFDNEGFLPAPTQQASSLLEEKITAQVGRGVLQLAALQNRLFVAFNASGQSSMMLQLFGGGGLCATSTPTCGSAGNPATPTVFNGTPALVTFINNGSQFHQTSANRDLLMSYETPIGENFHAGLSYVKSYYDVPSSNKSLQNDVQTSVTVVTPDSSQGTGEGRVFVGGNVTPKTSVDLSMYFANANYHVPNPVGFSSATGTSTNGWIDAAYTYAAPRLGIVWRPSPLLAIRGAVGGGFAEAPLSNLIGANGTCAPAATSCTVALQNPNLQPERAFAFDLGTDMRLPGSTLLSFDLYRANLFGQIFNSTTFGGNGTCPGNTIAPCYTSQFGNLGYSRFEAATLAVRQDVPKGVYWSALAGLTRGYVVSVPAGFYDAAPATCNFSTGAGCKNQYIVPGINFNGNIGLQTTGSIPYAQGVATGGYRWSPQKYVGITGTYYGNNNTYFWPAFMAFDGQISYPLAPQASVLFRFENITGIHGGSVQQVTPDTITAAPSMAGLPYALYAEQLGPRALTLTLQTRF